jgi:hypothetical protein
VGCWHDLHPAACRCDQRYSRSRPSRGSTLRRRHRGCLETLAGGPALIGPGVCLVGSGRAARLYETTDGTDHAHRRRGLRCKSLLRTASPRHGTSISRPIHQPEVLCKRTDLGRPNRVLTGEYPPLLWSQASIGGQQYQVSVSPVPRKSRTAGKRPQIAWQGSGPVEDRYTTEKWLPHRSGARLSVEREEGSSSRLPGMPQPPAS